MGPGDFRPVAAKLPKGWTGDAPVRPRTVYASKTQGSRFDDPGAGEFQLRPGLLRLSQDSSRSCRYFEMASSISLLTPRFLPRPEN